ncbi:hypothetical protein NEOLEDRAFT_1114287 [Neolentinus lepideus HHB14362 ss-1]|uniref:Peptidase C14 caspase domain-containing protein n=1 Tax=Neolentinus lepideus HHB14362 ss-1 TaxID=1314782 RepID=A0A165SQ61_9AGAM|nr:hypothetical protein NEOLEDRAFT_1114287 [Neolentinus lepideus HHB14362 ss-1]
MNWPAFPKFWAHSRRPRRSSVHQPLPDRDAVQMPFPDQSVGNPALANAPAQAVYDDGQTVQIPEGAHVVYAQGSRSHHDDRQTRHSALDDYHPSSHSRSHSRPPAQSQEHSTSHSHRHSHLQPQNQNSQYPAPTQHAQYPSHSQQNQLPPLQHPDFQYSRCTGKKKALCIGINYTGQHSELHGCINDAEDAYRFLREHYGFRDEDMVLLCDDTRNPRGIPTKKNIIGAMRWLVKDAQPHDSLFIHYSGHGGRTKDLDGDEPDGFDEDIYPVDYKQAGIILDDDLHMILVRPLPPACRLTAVFDSCHSGSILDLPFLYHSDGRVKSAPQVTPQFRKERTSPADVICFSGCTDSQTSADTSEGGVAVGAMSYAFTLSLKRNPDQSYAQLLRSVREILNKRYSQKPQLSSSHKIHTNLKFII